MFYFTYNGLSSKDFNLKIKEWDYINTAEKNIEEVEIPGRNGNLIIDYGNYKNRTINITCLIDLRKEKKDEIARKLNEWLIIDKSYKELRFSDSDDIYEAVCINKIDFQELVHNYFEILITFTAKPFKKSKSGEITITDYKKIKIINDGHEEAEPKFVFNIRGKGENIDLYINNRRYVFNQTQGTFTVDSELMNIYKEENGIYKNYNEIMENVEFPYLEIGENTVFYQGAVESLTIYPNIKYL